MDQLYEQVLTRMEEIVNHLAGRVSPPQRVPFKASFVFRHTEKSIHQAMVQKLARMVSTLNATQLLLNHGFVQEQAALQRILDEIQEDIHFLACGVIYNDLTPLHQKYLDAFFEEEFDAEDAINSTQKRPMIPRKKIRAHIARMEGIAIDPSRMTEVLRTMSKTYSGYIHAASPHIMDMYGGDPPRFQMRGMKGTKRHDEHREDIGNYFYRGICAFALVAKAFGDDLLFDKIRDYARQFERISGEDYSGATIRWN